MQVCLPHYTFAYFLAATISLLFFLPKVEPGYRLRPDFNWPVLATILPYSLGNYIVGLLSMVSQRLLPLLIIEKLGPDIQRPLLHCLDDRRLSL